MADPGLHQFFKECCHIVLEPQQSPVGNLYGGIVKYGYDARFYKTKSGDYEKALDLFYTEHD